MKPLLSSLTCIALSLGLLSGCANMNETQQGTAKGAGIGALAGAVLGAATGGSKGALTGAALGGAVGAGGGYLWSKKMQDQKVAMEQATAGTGVAVSQTADNRLKLDIPSDISFDVGRSANNPLSFDRANSARDYLVSRGVAAQRVATDGRGSREPVASNGTDRGRAQNRRVEIYVAEPAPR